MIHMIHMAPDFEGLMIPSDLLRAKAGISFNIRHMDSQHNSLLFLVSDQSFQFSLHIHDRKLILRRNESLAVLPMNSSREPSCISNQAPYYEIKVHWNYEQLILKWRLGSEIRETTVSTTPSAPPASLIRFARKQNLIEVFEYGSEEEFRAKVYACLESIQDKVTETGAIKPFWEFTYSGNALVSKLPKKETDIHGYIQCILSDQMFMASIEVIPEYHTGVGNLDFMFLGTIKNKGIARLCAKFKHAHSDDLDYGLLTQLPLYMQNKQTKYGAYCVLFFKGEWFDKPGRVALDDLFYQLQLKKLGSRSPILEGVRVFVFDFSKQKSASKR